MTSFRAYLQSNWDKLLGLSLEHLQMAFTAILFGLLVGIPAGVLIRRVPGLRTPVLWLANALQTIPALALAGFMMILLGLGRGTAVVVLFVYTLMPIVRSTYTGLVSVDDGIVEAARGMGMTRWQILRLVEFPLALSVLLVGVRLAAVIVIGTASIMSLIGAGGLGYEIFSGIARINDNMIIAGAALAAVLAVGADAAIGFMERKLTSPGIRIAEGDGER